MAKGTSWNTGYSIKMKEKKTQFKARVIDQWHRLPKEAVSLHPCRYSKPDWICPWQPDPALGRD